jgi:membrane protein implicated in regulation of membrane protease activity
MSSIPDQRLLGSGGRGVSWIQRVVWVALAALFAVAAFFFVTVALVAGALLAMVVAVRWWWMLRRLRGRAKNSQALEGEYHVVQNPRVEAHTPESSDRHR